MSMELARRCTKLISDAKYKGTIKADLSNSLYKQMPATIDSVFAREVTQLQSEIAYRQKHDAAKGISDYAHMKEPPEVRHATEVTKHQSNAEYKKGQGVMNKEPAVIGRPDFEHAVEASKLSSQIKYKEKFDNEMKDKRHHYNPLESAFRQSQLATALASDVKYKKDIQNMHDPVSDFPDLFLDHALKASKMLSGREYRKLFEENKGMYHFDADAAEHLHHKGNATLQSQVHALPARTLDHSLPGTSTENVQLLERMCIVKYKEEYEKNKGKSMLEFVETPSYQASKEAQKMQSEKEYKKDLENEIKGKGMELNSEILDIQRAKRASEMASEKEYKKDLESKIKGKGMQVGPDTLGIQHAKRASEMAREKDYKRDLETEIKGKGMLVSTDTPDIQRAKKASEMASQKDYKKDLENEIKGKGMQVSMDIPDMLRAKRASEIYSQKKYKDEAEKMLSNYSVVADTPEIQRVKTTQQNISAVLYRKEVGAATAVKDTPEIERVKKNQQNISSVKYHEDFEKTKGRGFTPVVDDPVTERVRKNTQVVSDAAYKGVHPHIVEMDRRPGIIVDLKVWRTDPGSIFDIDPLEDNIQSRSLHMLSALRITLFHAFWGVGCPRRKASREHASGPIQVSGLGARARGHDPPQGPGGGCSCCLCCCSCWSLALLALALAVAQASLLDGCDDPILFIHEATVHLLQLPEGNIVQDPACQSDHEAVSQNPLVVFVGLLP
ncbi:nebulette [Camelus ferus]|nr:nebulette [Camelus ferus]